MSSLKLAGLLCSRLCHDLAGPIGALQNSLELLSEDDDPALREQALDLVAMASSQASRKLRFFRLVFGAGLSGGQTLSSEECRAVLADLLDGGRIAVQWDLPPADWSRAHGRLLLALALLASHGLPRGGRIVVGPAAGGGKGTADGLAAIAGEGLPTVYQGVVASKMLGSNVVPVRSIAHATASSRSATERRARP